MVPVAPVLLDIVSVYVVPVDVKLQSTVKLPVKLFIYLFFSTSF